MLLVVVQLFLQHRYVFCPKFSRNMLLLRNIFIICCGCDVKDPESALRSAYLVQPCWFL